MIAQSENGLTFPEADTSARVHSPKSLSYSLQRILFMGNGQMLQKALFKGLFYCLHDIFLNEIAISTRPHGEQL